MRRFCFEHVALAECTDDIGFSNQSRTSRAQHEARRIDTRRTMMNTNLNHGSAKIYQFPVGGRSGVSGRHQDETKTAADLASSRASEVAVGGSRASEVAVGGAWYHEAAIQESNPVRES
jgi:predicted trehalose synthase